MLMFIKNLGKKVKSRKGYTLSELIVVVAILGILAAVATPMVLNQVQNARESADEANAKSISNAYKIAMTTSGTLTAPTTQAQARAIIDDTLNPIPNPQQNGMQFWLNATTGEVIVASASTSGASIQVSPIIP